MLELIDTHNHMYFEDFDADRDEVYSRALEAGVKQMLHIGIDLKTSERVLSLAEQHDFIFATAGVHPHDAGASSDEDIQKIAAMLEHPRMVGIGEIGLDFFRNLTPQKEQEEVLLKFLNIYKRLRKPLIFHVRDAFDRMVEMLNEFGEAPYKGLIHCFTGDKEIMNRFLDLGFHISFSGILTYKRSEDLREACRACPIDRILVETDAPYLPPQSKRGKRNESSYMIETAEAAADLHQMSLEDFAKQTTLNARQLFGLNA